MTPAEHFQVMFAEHRLTDIACNSPVPCFQLTHPTSEHNLVTVTATPVGVFLQYPWHPRGRTSNMPLSDFVGELEPSYLASKFLSKEWSRAAAETHFDALVGKLDRMGVENTDNDAIETAQDMCHLRDHDPTMFESAADWQRVLHRILDELVHGDGHFQDPRIDRAEAFPPLEYAADELGKLIALHDRFRDLFMLSYRLVDGRPVQR